MTDEKNYMPPHGYGLELFCAMHCRFCYYGKYEHDQAAADEACELPTMAYFGEQPPQWVLTDNDQAICKKFIRFDWIDENGKVKEKADIQLPDPNQLSLF